MRTRCITLTLSVLLLSGCWSYRELDKLTIVAGMAFDKNDGAGYHVTFETVDVSGAGESSQAPVKSKIVESDGSTIFDAVRNTIKKSSKKLYFSACKTVIINRELAGEGIAPVLDWLTRDAEPRLTVGIYIARDHSAQELIKQKSINDPINSYSIDQINDINPQFLSKSVFTELYKVNNLLGGEGICLSLPTVKMTENNGEPADEVSGAALFKSDRLSGFIDGDETKYLDIIRDQFKGGLLPLNMESDMPDMTLEIIESDTRIKPVLTGEKPRIQVSVKTEAALAEMMTAENYITEDGIKKVQKAAQANIEENCMRLIKTVQEQYGCDVFGFGSAVYKADPAYWKKIKPDWDTIFRTLEVKVAARVEIKNTAITKAKIKTGG